VVLLGACGNPYKKLLQQPTTSSALRFQPEYDKVLYRGIVDGKMIWKRFHLSGILMFKKMEDSSIRVVFQNEMGVSFFDFEWDKQQQFTVKQIIPQLDKKAVVALLQKDLQLLLMIGLQSQTESTFSKDEETYQRFTLDKGYVYYISTNNQLTRIENAGKQKVTTISLGGKNGLKELPERVVFKHHKANFTIQLKRIDDHVEE
jgi:hypothetical protein